MRNDRNDRINRGSKREPNYMRNSHNMVNESGNQMPKASNVNIAHLDMKPLLIMVMIFFFALLFMGIAEFVYLSGKLDDLRVDLVKVETTKITPYVIPHK